MNTKPIIYIVDDSTALTKALCWLIESIDYMVKSYNHPETFLDDAPFHTHGCIILDVRMPGMSGIELQAILHERDVKLPIIFISGHGDIPMVVETMKSGAFDFITKPINNQKLLDAINKALKQNLQRLKENERNTVLVERARLLTKREQEIAVLLAEGLPSKKIAKQLGISMNTVEIHRSNILRKMHCTNKVELANLFITNKLRDKCT